MRAFATRSLPGFPRRAANGRVPPGRSAKVIGDGPRAPRSYKTRKAGHEAAPPTGPWGPGCRSSRRSRRCPREIFTSAASISSIAAERLRRKVQVQLPVDVGGTAFAAFFVELDVPRLVLERESFGLRPQLLSLARVVVALGHQQDALVAKEQVPRLIVVPGRVLGHRVAGGARGLLVAARP